MLGKAKNQIPSLAKLSRQYPTEAACRASLDELRWPQEPFCPHCGGYTYWALQGNSRRPGLKECADYHHQYTITTKTNSCTASAASSRPPMAMRTSMCVLFLLALLILSGTRGAVSAKADDSWHDGSLHCDAS